MRSRLPLLGLIALLALAGCSGDSPYVVVSGGGIIFNYRIAEATAGIVAEVARPLPEGGTVEASFENPAGGAPIVESKPITEDRRRFSFVTPPLTGIKADTDYQVVVRVLDAGRDRGAAGRDQGPLRSRPVDAAQGPAHRRTGLRTEPCR